MKIIYKEYREVRNQINDGDIALFRAGWKLTSNIIARFGHTPSPYCHAAMIAWWHQRLFLLHTIQFYGGRSQALSQQVRDYPGHWDIYRVKKGRKFNSQEAINAAINTVGKNYGWWSLSRAAVTHLPLIRLWFPPRKEDGENGYLDYCSMAVDRWVRKGGIDLCPKLAGKFTEPGDIANSSSLKYMYTLNFTLGV